MLPVGRAIGRRGDGHPEPDRAERDLLRTVLAALLREDHLSSASNGAALAHADVPAGLPALERGEQWWCAITGHRTILLPVRADGFLADHVVSTPLVVTTASRGWTVVRTLEGALEALAPEEGDADAVAGWQDFFVECREALVAARLRDVARPALLAAMAHELPRAGFRTLLGYEALAALRDHPVHPTSRCRHGLTAGEQKRFAPEFRQAFPLRWTVVPRSQLRISPALDAAGLPGWWPAPSELGVPDAHGDQLAVPVHPLTSARGHLRTLPGPGPVVTPTLSMRTVALVDEPGVHLKLPLPTATLGRRNRRTIAPGTLADGAVVQQLLSEVLRREPGLAATVLLTEESQWIDSEDEHLAVLIRRYPTEVGADRLVPLAALLADDPRSPGRTVLDGLAGDDHLGWFDRYFSVLLDWHVALWLRYGIALEAHQQNITLALRGDEIRLVYKDNDGARIDRARLERGGRTHPGAGVFHDRRILAHDPDELADVFVTITLHLCVGAVVAEHTRLRPARRRALLELARTRILDAAGRWCDPTDPGSAAAAQLLFRVLEARRWPVKAMLTAGTLWPKARLGCTDINKYYRRSGPNYLEPAGREDLVPGGVTAASLPTTAGPTAR